MHSPHDCTHCVLIIRGDSPSGRIQTRNDHESRIIDVFLRSCDALDVPQGACGHRTDGYRADPWRGLSEPTAFPREFERTRLYGGRVFHFGYGDGLHRGWTDARGRTPDGAAGLHGTIYDSTRRAPAR